MSETKDSRGIRLTLKVVPNASRNEITGFKDGILQVKIAAPPEKGKANRELIGYLAERLGAKKTSISIIKGHTSRNKIVSIQGISNDILLRRISG